MPREFLRSAIGKLTVKHTLDPLLSVIITSLCSDDFWNYQCVTKVEAENYYKFIFQNVN